MKHKHKPRRVTPTSREGAWRRFNRRLRRQLIHNIRPPIKAKHTGASKR